MIIEICLLIAILFCAFYMWTRERYRYFEKLGIDHIEATFLLGSQKDVFTQKQNFFDFSEAIYKKAKSSIYGMFEAIQPVYLVNSPELCRQIFIKDFNHFVNHRKFFNDGGLFDHSLIQLDNEKWKEMRSTLSPAYTGNKMRGMFELIREIAEQAEQYLKENEVDKDVHLKEFFSRVANDVIASTAFGFQINSLKDKENKFYKMGKEVTTFTSLDMIKFLLLSLFNKYCRFLGIALFTKKQNEYYMNLVLGAMKNRYENKIFRPDMINMLMEVKGMGVQGGAENKSHFDWTDKEIVAQCFIFFFAGFDSVSTTLSFLGHELMENQEVQERLKEEIRYVEESLDGGPLTYEAVSTMKYTEACIYETLRKWPATPFLDRICNQDINLEDTESGKVVKFKVGDQIQVPIAGMHRDPRHFPDPMKFDPARFSEENKHSFSSNAFMPFGIGPRMCIGNRFALLEMKALIFYFLRDVSFKRSEKSTIPMILDPASAQTEPKGGIWVKVVADSK